MDRSADGAVSVQRSSPRTIAAVRARLPINRVGALFAEHLNQVYAAARDGFVQLDGQNIFVYRDVADAPGVADIEFGVGAKAAFPTAGAVICSTLPVGEVATATHWGDYARLGETHRAVLAWCKAGARQVAGPRWEVYGHWEDDPSRRRTDVYYLIEPAAS